MDVFKLAIHGTGYPLPGEYDDTSALVSLPRVLRPDSTHPFHKEGFFHLPGLWNHQFSGQGEIPGCCRQIHILLIWLAS